MSISPSSISWSRPFAGEFAKITGSVDLNGDDPGQARIQAVIDAASISTREPQRDAHLRSADFLDVEQFPTIEFRSTRVERTDDGLDVTGDLTIHGVTRPVSLRVETSGLELKDPYGNLKRGATATTRINRRDFGLTWNVGSRPVESSWATRSRSRSTSSWSGARNPPETRPPLGPSPGSGELPDPGLRISL